MNFLLKFLLIFAFISLASCKSRPAKIVDRSHIFYGKNNQFNKSKYSAGGRVVASSNAARIKVGSGDTLYSISRNYNVSLRDLIEENNLSAPYRLKEGSFLTIPKPRYHKVKDGETLYSISRLYNTKLDHLIEINNLQKPYQVKAGQQLRINNFNDNSHGKRVQIAKNDSKKEEGFVTRTLNKLNKFSWPIKGKIISDFGPKSGGLYNDGINIMASDGAEVKAAEDGVVAYVGNELKGYGNLVIVKHSGGWITAYAHLKDYSVKRGDKVNQGEKIARVGMSGNVSSPQLYFGLRKGRDAVNPVNYL